MKRVALVLLAAAGLLFLLPWVALGDTRTDSVSMTPRATNPIPSGRGGLYTLSSTGKPQLVDATGLLYPAGEARHVYTVAGAPGGAVLGDCWTDSTDSHRLYCKEGTGNLKQRFDGTAPGTFGCGTPGAGCFSSITIGGAPAEAFFSRTCTLTSAAAITPVNCLSNADVPSGKKPYLMGWRAKVNGATAWATTATCWIQDTGGTSNYFVTMAVAALTANAFVADLSANVTQQAPYARNVGGTADLGLEIACDANGTGSDLVVTIFGVIK